MKMAKEIIDLKLPEYAFLSGGGHEKGGNPLEYRDVVLHIPSATIIEFFEEEKFFPDSEKDIPTLRFTYTDSFGIPERHIAAIHYCATSDEDDELQEIIERATDYYCEYMRWGDKNLKDEATSLFN